MYSENCEVSKHNYIPFLNLGMIVLMMYHYSLPKLYIFLDE